MARVKIVDILDARGLLRARSRVEQLPATIGRAFDNDIILDDPFVSPHHARLIEDEGGQLILEDLGSLNGTRRQAHGAREARLLLRSGDLAVIGHTTLRLFDVDHVVPDAVPEHAHALPFAHTFLDRRAVAGAVLACVAYFTLQGYLGSTSRDAVEDVVPVAIGVFVLTALWAGLWALVGRITHAGARYLAHLGWTCAGAVVLTLIATLLGWGEFAVPSSATLGTISAFLLVVVATLYLAGHVTLASSLSLRQATKRLAFGVAAAAVVGALLTMTSKDRFSLSPEYPHTISALPTALLLTDDVDGFAAQTLKLQKEVDELAKKRERETILPNPMKGL